MQEHSEEQTPKGNLLEEASWELTRNAIRGIRKLRLEHGIPKKERIGIKIDPNSDLQLGVLYLYPSIQYYIEAMENCDLEIIGREIFDTLSTRESYFADEESRKTIWGHIAPGPNGIPAVAHLARERQLQLKGCPY